MFLRDREDKLNKLRVQAAFIKSYIDERPEGIDFLTWDKEAHYSILKEIIEALNTSRKGHPWQSQEAEYLIELFNMNMTFTEIAKELRRTRGSILAKLEKEECIPRNFHEYEKYLVRNKTELLEAIKAEQQKGELR